MDKLENDYCTNLSNQNMRLCLLIGVATAIMGELASSLPESRKEGLHWFYEAVTNVIYKNEPMPPMPDKGLR